MRADAAHSSWTIGTETFVLSDPAGPLEEHSDAAPMITPTYRRGSSSTPGAGLLLVTGAVALVSGMFLLVAANMLLHPAAWRWGFAMATGGQGVLIAAVAMMAIRLWRNSRRLHSQLDAVDRRLADVQSKLLQPVSGSSASALRSTMRRLDAPFSASI